MKGNKIEFSKFDRYVHFKDLKIRFLMRRLFIFVFTPLRRNTCIRLQLKFGAFILIQSKKILKSCQ